MHLTMSKMIYFLILLLEIVASPSFMFLGIPHESNNSAFTDVKRSDSLIKPGIVSVHPAYLAKTRTEASDGKIKLTSPTFSKC